MPRPALAALAAVLLAPQLAPAGPLAWTPTTSLTGDRGSGYVYLGMYARPDSYDPVTDRDIWRYGSIHGHLHTDAGGTIQTGATRVRLGHIGYGGTDEYDVGFYWNDPLDQPRGAGPQDGVPLPGGTLDAGFRAGLTLKDEASGQLVTFGLTGTVYMAADPALSVSSIDFSGDRQQGRAGRNVYTVEFGTEPGVGVSWLVADVSVAPAAATPEPGTAALAAAGLLAAGRWLRRPARPRGRSYA